MTLIFQVDSSETITVRRDRKVIGEISKPHSTFTPRPGVDLHMTEMEAITLFMSSTTGGKH